MIEGILEIIKDKSFEEYISSLNGKELKEFLIYLNAKTREIEPKEGGLYQDEGKYLDNGKYVEGRMVIPYELVAPRKVVQDKSFEKMAGMLKKVNNKEHKAIVMYTLINYLHLFQDGNGRTSRLLYDLITGKEQEKTGYYTHEKGKNYGARGSWDENRNLTLPQNVTSMASQFLMKYLLSKGLINSSYEDISKHLSIQTHNEGSFYISDENKTQLSKRTLEHVKWGLFDNNESISTSALSMLLILTNKGNLQPLKKYNCNLEWQIEGDFVKNWIWVGKTNDPDDIDLYGEDPGESAKRAFEGWTPEDYLKLVDVADKMKECIIDLIIDFAERPESFKYDKPGRNVIDVLNEEGKKLNVDDYSLEASIYNAPFEVDRESTVYESISQIREILDRPRTFDEEKFLIDTYEKVKINNSDLNNSRKLLEKTLEQAKQNTTKNEKDEEDIEWM